ncbi:HD domain-containing protein [Brevibacillus sp. SYP-B805]|uniref:HD domain-containing protein n=1 Tax=Brevibacillus sp. SYP-B805 TaxID=1578199 RepID=UPI0013EBDDFA|nr:HD domain-containing protein [Brevibacillus sp. SYP-B805]NGQ94182.1 HD domain-containing protein [Brevibacillus sp. SYP-B805]
MKRLEQQIRFLLEIDQLKQVMRQSLLADQSRRENDAEHSWHLAMMALVLAEYAQEPQLDLPHVIRMLLIHDLVEIYAGDTYAYDEKGYLDKAEREQNAAKRLFSLLPDDQAEAFHALWEEFERGETPEARFANVCDRLQPLLLNYQTQGAVWQKHGITSDMVMKRMQPIADNGGELWEYVRGLIQSAVDNSYLAK